MNFIEVILTEIAKYTALIFLLLFVISLTLKSLGVDPKTFGKLAPFFEGAAVLTGATWVYGKVKESGVVDDVKNVLSRGKNAEGAANAAKEGANAEHVAEGADEARDIENFAKGAEEIF